MVTYGSVMEELCIKSQRIKIQTIEISSVILHHTTGSVQLEVRLMAATNRFEVSENGNLAVSGKL